MDKQTLDFYQKHLSGWDPETMEGKCPVCSSLGFKVDSGGGFECPRGNLKGDTLEDFIEQVGEWRLHHLRRIVRADRNRKLLEDQGVDRDHIVGRLEEIENQRANIWDRLARMTSTFETTKGGAEEWLEESLEPLDDLIRIVTQELKLTEEETRAEVEDLIEFRDIEITTGENVHGEKVTKLRVRYLYRTSVEEFLPVDEEGGEKSA